MTSLLEKFGQNFLVATFIPSLGFILIANFLFNPLLPPELSGTFELSFSPTLAGNALTLFILTILFGFTLFGLNTFIYKLLEGYFLLYRIPWIVNRQRRKAIRRLVKIRNLDLLITELPNICANEDKAVQIVERLKVQSFSLKAQYKLDYPHDIRMVLPTRFGNILRAAETYPGERFGLDAVLMWPRLIHVMDQEYYKKLDQSNNGLAFIINSMILSLLLAGLCVLASGYQYYAWEITSHAAQLQNIVCDSPLTQDTQETSSSLEAISLLYFLPLGVTCAHQQMYWQRIWLYLLSSGVFLFTAMFFYNASLPAARQYGALIRSAYDLFRFDLIKQLRLTLPKHSGQEIDLWTRWTKLVALGRFASPSRLPFLYQYKPDELGVTLMTEEELYLEFLSEAEIAEILREEEE